MIFYLYNIYRYLVFSILRMKTKRSTTHGSTTKNKRIMSGGKGKISRYTRRFKDQYKRFIGINDADEKGKMEKMELWGKMNGIYKFLQVQKEKYKGADGSEVSGIEKMKENINATANSSNKEGYIKAIDCLQNGGDTILSGTKCVPYADFVNGGGSDDTVIEGDDIPPREKVTGDIEEKQQDEQPEEVQQQVGQQKDEQQDEQVGQQDEQQDEQQQKVEEQGKQQEVKQDEQQDEQSEEQQDEQPVEQPEEQQGLNDNNADNLGSSPLANATTGMGEGEVEEGQVEGEGKVKPEEEKGGGGRSRRHTRPSRRIKSRKSKKGRGRMTRRKHRGGRR